VIIGITSIVQALMPFELHWEHMKGHQDDVVPAEQLTRMEQLNILADELALQCALVVHIYHVTYVDVLK
jgi:hypothetical protein